MSNPLQVLIVEDSESDAALVVRLLGKAGYDVHDERVESAGQMQAALTRHAWDVVIADYRLPEFDAPAALTVLQQTGLNIPFIVVSGTIGEETAVAMMKAGAHDYLMKDKLQRLAPAVEREIREAETRRERRRMETELRKLSRAIEYNPASVVITDLAGNIEYVNPKFTEVTGYTAAEVMGQTPRLLKSDETPAEEYQRLWETIIRGGTWRGEFHNKKKNGLLYWENASISPVLDEQGKITHFVAVKEDITQRKQVEEQLRQSEAALKQAQRVAHVGSWKWRIQDNSLEWSDEMYHIFGIGKETFSGELGEVIGRVIHPDDRAVVERSNLSVSENKQPVPLEYRVIWPDGTVRVVWAEAGELILDDAGNPVSLTGIAQDITERKRTEEVLRQSEARYRLIADHVNDIVWQLDKELRFAYTSPVVEHILGYSVEETHQFSVANLLDAEGIALMRQVIQTRLTGGQKEAITPVEYKMRHKDGRWVDVEVVSSAIFDPEGQLLGFVGVTRDITERKQAEEKMKQQLDELRRWHDLTLGRETRNLELKHEVNELLRRLNEPIRYPSAEA